MHRTGLVARYQRRPHLSTQRGDQPVRFALLQNASLSHDGQTRTEVGNVIDDVRGQDHDDVFADLGEQVLETAAFGGVQPCRGFVDDEEARTAQQRLGDAVALLHAPGEGRDAAVARIPQVGLHEQLLDHLPLLLAVNVFERGEVPQHAFGGGAGIGAEFLWQVAQHFAQRGLVPQRIDAVEGDGAAVRRLQRGDGSHQGRLARAVRAKQTEQAAGDVQVDVPERGNATGIGPSH